VNLEILPTKPLSRPADSTDRSVKPWSDRRTSQRAHARLPAGPGQRQLTAAIGTTLTAYRIWAKRPQTQ
jgi:hypothetical protein